MRKSLRKYFSLLLCLAMLLSACQGAPAETTADPQTATQAAETTHAETEPVGAYTDGTFTGSANGMGGALTVSVTVEGGRITSVEVTDHKETPMISDPAPEQLPGAIVEAQSVDLDVVAGASVTSRAILEAVSNALNGITDEKKELEIQIDPDIIVVGAGMAGLTAAVRAAELGAKVLVLEQNYRVGGSGNTYRRLYFRCRL